MTVRILVGDVRDRLKELPDESVHCVVTSPPYWGLRDYGVAGQLGLEPTLGDHLDAMAARADYAASVGQIVEDAKSAGIDPKAIIGEMTLSAWMRDRSKPQGHVYFARVRNEDSVKIGFSTAVRDRMRAIENQWAIDIELIGSLPGTMDDERWFHRTLDWARDYGRKGTEFFVYSPIAGFIEITLGNADLWPFDEDARQQMADWVRRVHDHHRHIEEGAPRLSAIRRIFDRVAEQQRPYLWKAA